MPWLNELVILGVFFGAATGTLLGLGGAVLIVPILVAVGVDTIEAAAIGLVSVASASSAAAPRQLRQGYANHRLAVTIELGAATGAIGGTLLLPHVPEEFFRGVLIAAIAVSGFGAFLRRGTRNHPDPTLGFDSIGEYSGGLHGAYRLDYSVVPYRAVRVPVGVAIAGGIGLVAGVSGTSGGYLKTPLMSEVMFVPVKVAAATTSFASGLTAVAGLSVLLPQGVLDWDTIAGVVVAALLGGVVGGHVQSYVPPPVARYLLAGCLSAVIVALLWFA